MMDKEQIIFIASLTVCALGLSAFVLWGPKIGSSKRRRGPLIGLQNLGFTCFLNTLMQALASCHLFVEWLEQCNGQGQVTDSLLRVLKILNSENDVLKEEVEDPYSPNEVIDALKQHGWAMSPGEQDAHELFHLFILTLEEEAQRNAASLTDCLSQSVEESDSIKENPTTDCLSQGDNEPIPNGDVCNSQAPTHINECLKIEGTDHGEPVTTRKLPTYDNNRNPRSSPFCGLLTSHLGCTKCGFKSVKYDKFDSLSLHLPAVGACMGRSTLTHLLDKFVRTELISGVACDGCNIQQDTSKVTVTSTSVKTLSIGKLPQCLCLHIVRTAMGPNSTPFKRQDYVEFPEFLVMDPYTRNSMMKNLKDEMGSLELESQFLHSNSSNKTGACNHLYRIKAVVVHRGSVDSGHFVTYRRGPIGSHTRHRCSLSSRWYYTSDADIRESTLCEALQATAYMLFYEKCASASSA